MRRSLSMAALLTCILSLTACPGSGSGSGGQGGAAPPPPTRQLYVTNLGGNSIVTFGVAADGTVDREPFRVIRGDQTGLHNPMAVSVPRSGEMFVANLGDGGSEASVTIHAADARDDAPPLRTIAGPAAGLSRPNGIRAGQGPGILVTNHVEAGGSGTAGVLEYSQTPGQDAPMGAIEIAGAMGQARGPGNEVVVTDPAGNRVLFFAFASGSRGPGTPSKVIAGPNTLLDQPIGVAFDGTGRIYVLNRGNASVTVYAPAPDPDAAPLRRLGGTGTQSLHEPQGIAVDDAGNVFVSQGNVVLRFAPDASGGDAPAQRLDDPALSGTMGLAIR